MFTPAHRIVALAVVTPLLAVALAGCAGDGDGAASPDTESPTLAGASPSPVSSPSTSGDDHGEFPFGEPADAAAADRTIEIRGLDTLAWDPATVEIALGETVTFRVANEGLIPHDFTLGTAEMQREHEEEMASGPMAHDEPNAFVVQPGETREMTWTFTSPGQVLYGCHQPGHYNGGMVGTIVVAG
jgi:uncharacterized cupredoxin-like copper-binding protein